MVSIYMHPWWTQTQVPIRIHKNKGKIRYINENNSKRQHVVPADKCVNLVRMSLPPSKWRDAIAFSLLPLEQGERENNTATYLY